MKTIRYTSALLVIAALTLSSCGGFKGSATDTTGTNGATNGNGKVMKTERVHNYQN